MSSVATKRKYVFQELGDMSLPSDSQSIVQIVQARGHNLHEVVTPTGEQYIVSMPTKFRQNIWVKRGDYIVVEPIMEGKKVKGEIVKILTKVVYLAISFFFLPAIRLIKIFFNLNINIVMRNNKKFKLILLQALEKLFLSFIDIYMY